MAHLLEVYEELKMMFMKIFKTYEDIYLDYVEF